MDLPVYFVDSRNLIAYSILNDFHDFRTMGLPYSKNKFATLVILKFILGLKIRSEVVERVVLLNGNFEYLLSSVIKVLHDVYLSPKMIGQSVLFLLT